MSKKYFFPVALLMLWSGLVRADLLQPVASYVGSHDSERCAYWINPAGDINGDGLDDFLMGTSHSGRNGWESGTTYLILGRSQADWGMRRWLNNSADAVFLGDYANYSGYAVAGGGDINGDGLDDILIGSGGRVSVLTTYPGRAFLVFGRTAADWGGSFKIASQSNVIFNGEKALDQAGVGVSIIGDVNGDGYDDFIISSNGDDSGGDSAGKVYLFLGKQNWSSSLSLGSSNASFIGRYAGQAVGYCISRLGDVNGDHVPDFIIGSYTDVGETYLVFGRSSVNWGKNYSLSNADVIFISENIGDKAGFLVADAGDVNNDGLGDILIGAYGYASGAGKAYLIFGRSSGWPSRFYLSDADASFIGEAAGDQVGAMKSLGGSGDYDGDGYGDFLIGAPFNDQAASDAGKVYLIRGKPTGWQRNENLANETTYFTGESAQNYAGDALNFVRDLNGDGRDDFVVAAPYNSYSYNWSGQNYIFLGIASDYRVTGSVTCEDTETPVASAQMTAGGSSPTTVTTDAEGTYRINYSKSQTFTVTPSKTRGAYLAEQGVTSFDASLILRQVLGLTQLTSAQRTRGDVNQDGAITLVDAVLIGRCYANMPILTGSHAGEWVFTPTNRTYTTIQSDFTGQDYSARLIGDIDQSYTPGGSSAKINATTVTLIPDGSDRMVLALSIPSATGMFAADIRLRYDPNEMQFESVEQGNLAAGFYSVSNEIEPGHVVAGFFGARPVDESGVLCRILFKPSKGTAASSVLLEQFTINGNVPVDGTTGVTSRNSNTETPRFELASHPNPFNAETAIMYSLSSSQNVRIVLYNLKGERVRVLSDRYQETGTHRVRWDGRDERDRETASGIYLCRLESPGQSLQIKLLKVD